MVDSPNLPNFPPAKLSCSTVCLQYSHLNINAIVLLLKHILICLAPTAVRELNAFPSSPESIFITWDHPEYPNSQLLEYFIFYQMDPLVVQQTPNISSDEFLSVTSPADSASLTFNLTGLSVFTNYSIHMTVSADGEENAPIEVEILSGTNPIGEYCVLYSLNFHVMEYP